MSELFDTLKSRAAAVMVALALTVMAAPPEPAHAQVVAASSEVALRDGLPPPGRYRIQSRSSGKCLGWVVRGLRQTYLGLMLTECTNNPDANLRSENDRPGRSDRASLYIVPINSSTVVFYDHGECLTRARGVLIGAPSIDYVNCGQGVSVIYNGLAAVPDDQRFRMAQAPNGSVRIYPVGLFGVRNRQCLTVRDNGQDPATDIISWACHAGADQEFDLIYMGPLSPHLQREHDAAMAAERVRLGDSGAGEEVPVATIAPLGGMAAIGTAGTVRSAAKLGGARPLPSLAGATGAIDPNALRAALTLPPPAEMALARGFVLDMGVPVAETTLQAPHNRAAWQLALPYRFAVEGLKAALVECSVFDASGILIGHRAQRLDLAGPSAGTLLFGVPRLSGDGTAAAARSLCQATLGGDRAGVDWEAWTFEAPSAPGGWDVFVKEAGKTRFWTGAPFLPGFSLRTDSAN